MDGDGDFSRFPDDLLLRILYFLPHTAGAATTAVSKRWSPLWTTCGAINLEARILESDMQHMLDPRAFFANRDKFLAAALKVLDDFNAAPRPVPVTRLTFRVEGQTAAMVRDFINREANYLRRPQVLGRVLAHPAARFVQELRISAVDTITGEPMLFEEIDHEAEWASFATRMYSIDIPSLPCSTLRVLDLTNCGQLAPGLTLASFPHLWKLRLRHCQLLIPRLQSIINSASILSSIYLESVLLEDNRVFPLLEGELLPTPTARFLRCPQVTTLAILKCCLKEDGTLQICSPKLQHFEYKGINRHIELSPPPQDLVRVDITINKLGRDPAAAPRNFWSSLRGFIHTKQLNLSIRLLGGIAINSQGIGLPVLGLIKRLQLCLVFKPNSKRAAAFIADMLSCCPPLVHLRVNLTTHDEDIARGPEYSTIFLERKFQDDLRLSESSLSKSSHAKPAASAMEDLQGAVHYAKRPKMQPQRHFFDELAELPGLGNRHFECMNNSLKTVALQFRKGEKNTYGVGLVKFFAENGKVLDEMLVDAGNAKLGDHLNDKISNWVAGWTERRRIKILPLERQN